MAHTTVQNLTVVTAHFTSEQLLPFGFAEQHRVHTWPYTAQL